MKTPLSLMAALAIVTAAPAALAQAAPTTPDASPSAAPEATREGITSNKGPGGRNITAFDRNKRTGLGGYYDIEFKQPLDGRPSTFDLHRLILTTSSYLHENLFFNAEIEFEHGGMINAGTNDGELKIEQAWADYTISDLLHLRAGTVLIPFGIVNVLHDSDVRETTTRPLMASNIIPTTWMEPGVGLHGIAYPTEELQLTYEAYVTQGLSGNISAARGVRNARPSQYTDNNGNKAVSGRVGISPWLGFEVGLDAYHGAYDVTGEQHMTMLGADMAYTAGPFEVIGEYANITTEGGTFTPAGATAPAAIPLGLNGYYLEGRYRFFPEILQGTWLGRGGGFANPTFTAFARYGGADTDSAAG
ncbi:MAG: porin, partial [Candidatus Sericytochromatia bacterium]